MKRRGRPTKLNAELTASICGLLSEGISITACCDALAINQDSYFSWVKKDAEFSEKTTCARAAGKIALIRQILADKDWRAKAWYLERCWPGEFGRTVERPLPKEERERGPSVAFVFSMPDGKRKSVSLSEAEKIFCRFPPTIERPKDQDEADAVAVEDRDFQRWDQYGVMPNVPDNGDED